MTDVIDRIIDTLNTQKGELMGVNTMLTAFARTLPPEQLARLLAEFDNELQYARAHVNNSPFPDEVISGLESYVTMWNAIRSEPNLS